MENHFLKYIQSITGGRAEGSAIERRHCSHLKPKRFSLLSPLSLSLSLSVRRWCANVHRLRTPCPRRGIVKYYTGAGGDVEGVTVSNFSSLSLSLSSHFFPSFFFVFLLPRYIARCIASVSEMQIAGRSPMACFRYPPFRAVILIGELLSSSSPWRTRICIAV